MNYIKNFVKNTFYLIVFAIIILIASIPVIEGIKDGLAHTESRKSN